MHNIRTLISVLLLIALVILISCLATNHSPVNNKLSKLSKTSQTENSRSQSVYRDLLRATKAVRKEPELISEADATAQNPLVIEISKQ